MSEKQPQDNGESRRWKEQRRDDFGLRAEESLSVVYYRPKAFDDVSGMASQLRFNNAVIINLEESDVQLSRRLLDFLAGAAYIADGKLVRIAASAYMLLPSNLYLDDETFSELSAQDF